MDSSKDFIAWPNTPGPAWAWPFASELSNVPEGEFGSTLSEAGAQRFSLQSPAGKASGPAVSNPVSVLIVEDNPGDVGLIREALEENGVEGELLVATDGQEGIKMIDLIELGRVRCPDLFIVDLNLPKKSGREVLEHLRQGSKCSDVPVAVFSSSDSRRDREDATRIGVTEYLRKPSRLEDFVRLGVVFKAMLGSSAK